jgi:hypothetical protein
MVVGFTVALVVLYRVQIKLKVFPNNSTAKTIIGDSKQYFSLI